MEKENKDALERLREKIKKGNLLSRQQALEQMVTSYNFKSRGTIDKINVKKFKDEGVNIFNNKFYDYTVFDFLNNFDFIIDLIAMQDKDKIRNYVNNL